MKTDTFNRKKRQFRNLAKQVNQLIFNGNWGKLSVESRNKIILKLNALYRQLCSYFSPAELKKILAAAAIFIGFPLATQAQSFAPPQLNPFGLSPDSVEMARPAFVDIDNDEDLDLFTGVYDYDGAIIQFYKNTGNLNLPAFALPQTNPFGIDLPPMTVGFPAFADIDNDGDQDLFLGATTEESYDGQILFFQNNGTPAEPAFGASQLNPFGLTPTLYFAITAFADIDNDGDLDLFAGEFYGNMKFFENTGTVTEPAFAAPLQNPFGITPAYQFGSPAFSDIDHDGDLDLFVGEYYGNFQYFRNSGTAQEPSFAIPIENPFGLIPTYAYCFPAFADLDGDGDEDILAGEYYGMFQYFKNTEINVGINENTGEAFFSLYPNPVTDMVNIKLMDENAGNPLQVSIIDLNGRIVEKKEIKTNDLRLTTKDLKPGIYFVRLVQGDKVYTRKLVKR